MSIFMTAQVILRRRGQFLHVEPVLPELRRALTAATHAPASHPLRGMEIRCVLSPLYREIGTLEDAGLESFMGLLPVIRQTLAAAGHHVEERFADSPSLPEPNFPLIGQLGNADLGLLELVRQQERGLIRYQAGAVDPARMIGQIALAWPDQTLAVAVTRIEEARAVRDQLKRFLPGVVAITSRNHPAEEQVGRVVVATYTGLGHNGVEIEKRDLVIALHASEASRPGPLSLLGHASRARLYGLLETREATAPLEQDAVRLLFGFHEVLLHRHGCPPVQVEVVRCPHGGGRLLPENLSILEIKRLGLWQNRVRNRRLARLAQLLQFGDVAGLREHFPAVLAGLQGRNPSRVLLLVENVEHGLALVRLLPCWPLLTTPAALGPGRGKSQGIEGRMDSSEGNVAIATLQGLVGSGGFQADVVIRADGGTGLPLDRGTGQGSEIYFIVNNSVSLLCATQAVRILLVDLDDRHHPLLRRWSRQRWRSYAELGWYAPGVDPVQARVDRFLANRPEENP